eukprot:scaffold179_cov247-Pinguiococcus_pyrenoidosus.AAC.1
MQAGRDSKTKGGDAEEDAKSNRFLDASKVLSSSRAHEESISTAPMSSQAETKEERGRDADRKSNGPESLVESASPTPKLDSSHAHKEEERKGCEREEGDGDATEDATEQVSAESHQVGDQEKKEEGQDAAISNEFPRVTRRVEGAGSPTTIRQPFDEAVDAITEGFEESSALKGLRDQVDRLKTRTFRYEQKAFQDILRALEKVKEQMDKARDSGEQDGTTGTTRPRPRWTLFARHKKSLDDVCKEIEGKLAELMKEPYAPNPHGDLSTVYWKKAVQAASVVAQVFPIPGLDQLLSALTAHLDAMANEGDYVADAKRHLRVLGEALILLERSPPHEHQKRPRRLALESLRAVTERMDVDVEEWLEAPGNANDWTGPVSKIKEYLAGLLRTGVSRAIDFEAKMKIHSENLAKAIGVLQVEIGAENRGVLQDLLAQGQDLLSQGTDHSRALRVILEHVAPTSSCDTGLQEPGRDAEDFILISSKQQQRRIQPRAKRMPKRCENFPMSPTKLIGRDEVLADITARLERPGAMISITGTAGVGKSKVAEAAA